MAVLDAPSPSTNRIANVVISSINDPSCDPLVSNDGSVCSTHCILSRDWTAIAELNGSIG